MIALPSVIEHLLPESVVDLSLAGVPEVNMKLELCLLVIHRKIKAFWGGIELVMGPKRVVESEVFR